MAGLAFLFPGQGSQAVGMGRDLAAAFPEARAVYDRADAALAPFHLSISRVSFEGTEDELRQTAVTQPAILVHSVAAFEILKARGLSPTLLAGHSLGEWSALVAGGALTLEDAVVLVHRRGTFMQAAVAVGQGAMAAVLGLDAATVAASCDEAATATGETVSVANFNSPEQTVIAGTANAVAKASELLRQREAKRILPLPVSAPFHCALMKPAEENLSPFLDAAEFADLAIPVVTNVDVLANVSGTAAREALRRQVCSPVRWVETVERLSRDTSGAIEVGPGTVLSGLARRIVKDWPVRTTSDEEGVRRLLAG